MTRIWLAVSAVALVGACGPKEPPAQGVGFSNIETIEYSEDLAREAQLQTPLRLNPENTGAPAPRSQGNQAISARELAAAGINISSEVRVRRPNGTVIFGPAENSPQAVVTTPPARVDPPPAQGAVSTSNPAPVASAAPAAAVAPAAQTADVGAPLSALKPGALSDEQDFAAVSSRESIESDAARLATQRSQRSQVEASVGSRPAQTGPDVVAFALATSHPVGTKAYGRTFASEAKARRACARYSGADQAQRAFLEAGGPQRDRLGLDPDGDGYACGWSPEPFRAARAG